MKLLGVVVATGFVLASCTALDPRPSVASTPDFGEGVVPAAFLNGTRGVPVMWCENDCISLPSPPAVRTFPVVVGPEIVRLPEGARIDTVTAWGPGLVGGDPNSYFNVPFHGMRLDGIPEGTVSLEIRVMWRQTGTASYLWHVDVDDG